MVSGPHSSKMALGGLFNISRENSSEIFEMLLPKNYALKIMIYYDRLHKDTYFFMANAFFFHNKMFTTIFHHFSQGLYTVEL